MTGDQAALELELKLAEVKARQGRPAAPRRGKATGPDVAHRAAHDYDPEDLETPPPAPTPSSSPDIPAHLRQYLVSGGAAATGSRLEASRRQIGGTKDNPVPIGNEHGYLGMDWPGLWRMADARRRAGLPLDDLDVEALNRGDHPADESACPPPAPPSTSPPSASSSSSPPTSPDAGE